MARKSGEMGFVDFTSHKVDLPTSAEAVFNFLRNLNNFEKMMPEQIINWHSSENDCEFDIKGMAHISLVKSNENPASSVELVTKPDNPIELKLRGDIESTGKDASSVVIGLSADLSPILKLMASAPLQNLVNIMADRLKAAFGV